MLIFYELLKLRDCRCLNTMWSFEVPSNFEVQSGDKQTDVMYELLLFKKIALKTFCF